MIQKVFRIELHYGSKFEIIEICLFWEEVSKGTKAALICLKNNKNSNIVKCDYNLKELFVLMYFKM